MSSTLQYTNAQRRCSALICRIKDGPFKGGDAEMRVFYRVLFDHLPDGICSVTGPGTLCAHVAANFDGGPDALAREIAGGLVGAADLARTRRSQTLIVGKGYSLSEGGSVSAPPSFDALPGLLSELADIYRELGPAQLGLLRASEISESQVCKNFGLPPGRMFIGDVTHSIDLDTRKVLINKVGSDEVNRFFVNGLDRATISVSLQRTRPNGYFVSLTVRLEGIRQRTTLKIEDLGDFVEKTRGTLPPKTTQVVQAVPEFFYFMRQEDLKAADTKGNPTETSLFPFSEQLLPQLPNVPLAFFIRNDCLVLLIAQAHEQSTVLGDLIEMADPRTKIVDPASKRIY